MNLKQLKAFLAVADGGSVTAAADRLNLTQPGVSRQIAALEAELEFPLFDRVRGRLIVNRRGSAFLRHARHSVDAVDHLPRAARAIAAGTIDRVTVVATSSIVHGLLPPAIDQYIRNRPGLPPSVIMRGLREIVDLAPEDQTDLVLAPMPVRPARFNLIETINVDLVLAGPSVYLPSGDDEVDLGTLGRLPFISLDPFATYQESIESALEVSGTKVAYICETSSVVTAGQLVRLGVGCAFLDPFIARSVSGPETTVRKIKPSISHTYGIYAAPGTAVTGEVAALLDAIHNVVDT